jgi:hypothetical protein
MCNYELYSDSNQFIGQYDFRSVDKVCRFCTESFPKVQFNNIPHLVPELFGENNTSSNFECDDCNKKFSVYESHTASFIQHHLTVLGKKSKQKIPIYQSKRDPDGNFTRMERDDSVLKVNTYIANGDIKFHTGKGVIQFTTKPFVPFYVYKVLLKIGIALLKDDDLRLNNHFLDYLTLKEPNDDVVDFYTAHKYINTTLMFERPRAVLFRAKNMVFDEYNFPEYILVLYFANVALQLFLPMSANNKEIHTAERGLYFHIFPIPLLNFTNNVNQDSVDSFDLRSVDKSRLTDYVHFCYDPILG